MKMKKVNQETVIKGLIKVLAVGAGVMVSDGIVALIPEQTKQVGKLGIGGAGLAGVVALPGKTTKDSVLSGLALGMAVKQGYNLAKDAFSKSVSYDPNGTLVNRFIGGAVGLACPSGGQFWEGGNTQQSYLASPIAFPQNDVMVWDNEESANGSITMLG